MNRREFLKAGLVCTGGLIATEALPAVNRAASAKGPMTINYISLPVGAARPFSMFHISDTHLHAVTPNDSELQRKFVKQRFVGWDCEDALAESIAWAQAHKSDYLLHTGDLIDFVSEGNLLLLKKFFGENAKILYAPGNHDYATTFAAPRNNETEAWFRAQNTARVQAVVPVDMTFNSSVINGVNVIMLDNVYGTVAPSAVERFHAEAKKGLPIILTCHVPFYTEGIWRACARAHGGPYPFAENIIGAPTGQFKTQMTDPTTAAFIDYLKKEPLLKAILCGHHHAGMTDRFSPTCMQYVAAANYRYFGQEVMVF